MARRQLAAVAALLVATAGCAAERPLFDWDEIGSAFCRSAVAEDVAGLGPILTPSLRSLIEQAHARGPVPPRLLLQGYDIAAPGCTARTRNAAIVDIAREGAEGERWRDQLVMVPERDGSTRIDDILYGTRPSDTLRERLRLLISGNRPGAAAAAARNLPQPRP
jgi:hypothetical protein